MVARQDGGCSETSRAIHHGRALVHQEETSWWQLDASHNGGWHKFIRSGEIIGGLVCHVVWIDGIADTNINIEVKINMVEDDQNVVEYLAQRML